MAIIRTFKILQLPVQHTKRKQSVRWVEIVTIQAEVGVEVAVEV